VSGVDLKYINDEYVKEATIVADIDLPKSAMQPAVLGKVLFRLISGGLVYKTHDDKYITDRSELLFGFGRNNPLNEAAMGMMEELSGKEKGNYTDKTLEEWAMKKYKLTYAEYRFLITSLTKDRWVMLMTDGKIYCTSSPPNVPTTPDTTSTTTKP
jgi:hypothetical protein